MSLFKVCFRWSSQCPDTEDNYDQASLICARFGLQEYEKDYVVVGSQAGFLSIFYPSPNWESDGETSTNVCNPTDLLLETKLKYPILGLYSGKFSGNSSNEKVNQLAVLHPNSLAIYNIKIIEGVTEHGTQTYLQIITEQHFKRAAFALCSGHFGKIKGREFYCIVHLDGSLSFYEQDGISYECHLSGHRSMPSPIVYSERTDSFFSVGATWTLECYTYQDLSYSSMNRSKCQPVWTLCLGEGVMDLNALQIKESSSLIVVLGEKNIICVTDNGTIEFILKLDYIPKCICSFVAGYYWEPNARLLMAVISENSRLHIYEGSNLKWAAQLEDQAPVAMKRSNLNNLPGGIVILGPYGLLSLGYLGSEPFAFTVSAPSSYQEMKFEDAYKSLARLEDEIKEALDIGDIDLVNQRAAEDVRITFEIDQNVLKDFEGILTDVPADVAVLELPSCRGLLSITSKIALAEIQINLKMPQGLRCNQDTQTFTNIEAGASKSLSFDFFIAELLHFDTARIDAIISFINSVGIMRVLVKSSYLPLQMFFKPKLPQKSASIKLTFDTEFETTEKPILEMFFPEFRGEHKDMQALGLVLIYQVDSNQPEEMVTFVAAKTTNRFRVQTDNFLLLPLIMERLVMSSQCQSKTTKAGSRAKKHSRISRGIRLTPTLPTQEVLQQIDKHRDMRENINKQSALIDDLWTKFKTFQRQMQDKSEDEPKESLALKIEQIFDNLITEGDKLTDMRNKEKRLISDLSSSITAINILISCLPIEENILNIISAVLCSPVEDWTTTSWEESVSPGIDMLYHYGPFNRHSDTNNNNNNNNLCDNLNTSLTRDSFDYKRFRRHFLALFERIIRISNDASTKVLHSTIDSQPDSAVPTKSLILSELQKTFETGNAIRQETVDLNKPTYRNRLSLDPVEDNENEEENDEINRKFDSRKVDDGEGEVNGATEIGETSDWVGKDFELPSSDELFNDLGIWW